MHIMSLYVLRMFADCSAAWQRGEGGGGGSGTNASGARVASASASCCPKVSVNATIFPSGAHLKTDRQQQHGWPGSAPNPHRKGKGVCLASPAAPLTGVPRKPQPRRTLL